MSYKGVRDLMDAQRYTVQHIQRKLLEEGVTGNWLSVQNVYNLVNGKVMPKDGYIFIFLADFLGEDIRKILSRYSVKQTHYSSMGSNIF